MIRKSTLIKILKKKGFFELSPLWYRRGDNVINISFLYNEFLKEIDKRYKKIK